MNQSAGSFEVRIVLRRGQITSDQRQDQKAHIVWSGACMEQTMEMYALKETVLKTNIAMGIWAGSSGTGALLEEDDAMLWITSGWTSI